MEQGKPEEKDEPTEQAKQVAALPELRPHDSYILDEGSLVADRAPVAREIVLPAA